MKNFYIPVGILAVILGFSLWSGRYVAQRTEHWSGLLEQADEAGHMEDWDAAREQMDRTYRDWQGSQTFFHIIMDHDALDDAEESFAGAFAVCQEAGSADFHMLLAQLAVQLELLAETQSVSIKNVL